MTAAQPATSKGVQTVTVTGDENGMRLDRFFEARFPGLSFSHIQRIIRKGEVRVNGKRAQPKDRLQAGQAVRIPPLKLDAPKPRENATEDQKNRAFIKSITLHEDDDVMVLNKPMGLAVQGGSGTTRHIDGMLEVLRAPGRDGQRPRLVHRLLRIEQIGHAIADDWRGGGRSEAAVLDDATDRVARLVRRREGNE